MSKFKKLAGKSFSDFDELFVLPYDEQILTTEPDVTPLLQSDSSYLRKAKKVVEILRKYGEEE